MLLLCSKSPTIMLKIFSRITHFLPKIKYNCLACLHGYGWLYRQHKLQWHPAITNLTITKTTFNIRTTFESPRQNNSKMWGNKPRYNEPRYNEIPAITNWFWRSQCTIHPAITNILSRRPQSVKTMMIKIVDKPNTTRFSFLCNETTVNLY